MSYGIAANIAELAGVNVSYATTSLLAWIDSFINSHFNRSDFAGVGTEIQEIHHIRNKEEDSVVTKYFPVVAVTAIRDDILGSSPLTLNSLNYYVDTEAGIITLINNETSLVSGVSLRSYFTRGMSTVDISYTHGWATAPDEITQLANFLGAKIAKIGFLEEESSPGAIKKIRMGNYSEERFYDSKFMGTRTKYDSYIEKMLFDLNR